MPRLSRIVPALVIAGTGFVAAQGTGAPPQFATPTPVPPLFFREPWRQTAAFDASTAFQPERGVTPAAVTNPSLELRLYDPAAKSVPAYLKSPPTGSIAR